MTVNKELNSTLLLTIQRTRSLYFSRGIILEQRTKDSWREISATRLVFLTLSIKEDAERIQINLVLKKISSQSLGLGQAVRLKIAK